MSSPLADDGERRSDARMGESNQRRVTRDAPVARVRRKPCDDTISSKELDIVLLADCSAITVHLDDHVEWYPSLGVLLAAHGLEWKDVEIAR
jgi:hypothetical protein